jgi:prepilin-type processing-associated H-X9-DG protein
MARAYPYVKNVQLYQCPSQGLAYTTNSNPPRNPETAGVSFPRSYAIPCSTMPAAGRTMADIKSPATVAMIGETAGDGIFKQPWGTGSYASPNPSAECGNQPVMRHNGGSNWAYQDGHVKWLTFSTDKVTRNSSPGYISLFVYW